MIYTSISVLFITDIQEILLYQDKWGCTFLHWAAEYLSPSDLRPVLEVPDLVRQIWSVTDDSGQTVLHEAASNEIHTDLLLFLLEILKNESGLRPEGKYVVLVDTCMYVL